MRKRNVDQDGVGQNLANASGPNHPRAFCRKSKVWAFPIMGLPLSRRPFASFVKNSKVWGVSLPPSTVVIPLLLAGSLLLGSALSCRLLQSIQILCTNGDQGCTIG